MFPKDGYQFCLAVFDKNTKKISAVQKLLNRLETAFSQDIFVPVGEVDWLPNDKRMLWWPADFWQGDVNNPLRIYRWKLYTRTGRNAAFFVFLEKLIAQRTIWIIFIWQWDKGNRFLLVHINSKKALFKGNAKRLSATYFSEVQINLSCGNNGRDSIQKRGCMLGAESPPSFQRLLILSLTCQAQRKGLRSLWAAV